MTWFNQYLDEFLSLDTNNKKVIISFFLYFSRFEYAVKTIWFLETKKWYCETKWNSFENLITKKIIPETLKIETLINNPPKKMTDASHFKERNVKGKKDFKSVLSSVRIVRNNLFHGWKYSNWMSSIEDSRNIALVEEALLVLKYVIDNPDDNLDFENAIKLRNAFNNLG